MDIHEYQAKEILSGFGVEVAPGALAYSPEQAAYRARELGGEKWVVKAQVHAGGRGRAGGVKVCDSDTDIHQACEGMFGAKLVTHQTGPEGKGIYRVYVEAGVEIEREGVYVEPSLVDHRAETARVLEVDRPEQVDEFAANAGDWTEDPRWSTIRARVPIPPEIVTVDAEVEP